jgi:hypothetical protein
MISEPVKGKPEGVVEQVRFFTDEEASERARFDACLLADGRACVYCPVADEHVFLDSYDDAIKQAEALRDGTRMLYERFMAKKAGQ